VYVLNVKVPESPRFMGFTIPGTEKEKVVPPGGKVDCLKPLFILIDLAVVSMTQVGVVVNLEEKLKHWL